MGLLDKSILIFPLEDPKK